MKDALFLGLITGPRLISGRLNKYLVGFAPSRTERFLCWPWAERQLDIPVETVQSVCLYMWKVHYTHNH